MTTQVEPVAYPFGRPERLEVAPEYLAAQSAPGMIRVRLPYGEPAWLATRYADVRMVLADPRFSRAMAVGPDTPRLSDGLIDTGFLSMDPPEHTRLRRLVAKAFTQRRVELLRVRVRELADGLVDDMLAAGAPVNLAEAFALPLPVAVICEMLGVPVADRPRFRVWTNGVLSTSGATAEEFRANLREFRDYMSTLIAQRRAAPSDDLMTALIQARDERDQLSEAELVDTCAGILLAGHETTASQLPNFVYVLLHQPERLAELRADLDLIPAAVEELTRYVPLSAAANFPRYATEDVLVGETLVRAGEPVLISMVAANRDPRQFEAPDELRFDRGDNPHIGFGHGAHHCLGAQLARLELQEALRVLLVRLPGLRLAGQVEWKADSMVRGPRVLPLAW